MTCEFQRGKLDTKVVFQGNKVTGLFFVPGRYRPPFYADPSKFDEKDIQIGKGIWALPGTLSLPKGAGPFPAVVLVHGSGPHDRDETIGPNKPFRDLAQGLASRGIAVLRYEKRTKQHSIMMALSVNSITVKEETVDDAVAAVEALAAEKKIGRVFVLGHSLGGMLLPRIGKASPKIAGFISLAGSTRPLEDLVLEQTRYLLGGKEQDKLREIERQVAKAKSVSEKTPSNELPLGIPAKYWLDLRGYDPATAAGELQKPMLILQGERDYQVTMEDFVGWKKTLGSRKDVTFILYSKLNHLFMEGEGKSSPAEYSTPGNVAKAVIEDIAKWIKGPASSFEIKTKKPEDRVQLTLQGDTAVFDVSSPRGISGGTITLAKGQWPTTVILRLHLGGLESFAVSNGGIKLIGSVLSHSGNTKRLYLSEVGKEGEREPGTEIKAGQEALIDELEMILKTKRE